MNTTIQIENRLEYDLTCPICFYLYSQERIAKNLGDGHTICSICLEILLNEKQSYIKCPMDQNEIRVNDRSVKKFETNLSLMSIIDSFDSEKLKFKNEQHLLRRTLLNLRESTVGLLERAKTNLLSTLGEFEKFIMEISAVHAMGVDIFEEQKPNDVLEESELKKLEQFNKDKELKSAQAGVVCSSIGAKIEQINNLINRVKEIENFKELREIQKAVKNFDVTSREIGLLKSKIDTNYLFELQKKMNVKELGLVEKSSLTDIVKSLVNKEKQQKANCKIGIVGASRSGKSSFINRIRGIGDNLVGKSAMVQEIECTSQVVEYKWEQAPGIKFVDFPGYGRYESSSDYAKSLLEKYPCDYYIFVYTFGLSLSDIRCIKHIITIFKKKCVIARNKIDVDIDNKIKGDSKLTPEQAYKAMKLDTIKEKTSFKNEFNNLNFKIDDFNIFLISTKNENIFRYDFEDFIKEISKKSPNSEVSEAISMFSINLGSDVIKDKKLKLQKRIKWLCGIAAATDIVPVGGTIADIAILAGEFNHYKECFGLTKEKLDEYTSILGLSPEVSNSISKTLLFDSKYVNLKNFLSTIVSGVSVAVGSAATKAIFGAVGLGFGIVTFGVGCVVLGAITAPISYCLTKDVLDKVLNEMEQDANIMLKKLIEEKAKLNSSNLLQ